MDQSGTPGRTSLTVIDAAVRAGHSRREAESRYRTATATATAFDAQVFGQPGQRRGLKGGAPVLAAARGAYLAAEFTGAADRRPTPGLVKVRQV